MRFFENAYSDHMIPMRGTGFQMIPICRAQLLDNSLGYYLVADRSILVSFEILRLRIGSMWSDSAYIFFLLFFFVIFCVVSKHKFFIVSIPKKQWKTEILQLWQMVKDFEIICNSFPESNTGI